MFYIYYLCDAVCYFASEILLLLLLLALLSPLWGFYYYIPETNHVSKVYIVADVLYLLFVRHVMSFCP